jgi:transcriptional regulator with XRE-family HTH domain
LFLVPNKIISKFRTTTLLTEVLMQYNCIAHHKNKNTGKRMAKHEHLKTQVSKRIKSRADVLGLSQADIAKGTSTSKSSVNAWFKEKTVPTGEKLIRLSKLLKCTQNWLLEGKGTPGATNDVQYAASLPGTWSLVNGSELTSQFYQVPALSSDGEADQDDLQMLTKSALSGLTHVKELAWIQISSDCASPMVSSDDIALIDTTVKKIIKSGGLYAIKAAGAINVYQIFAEIDGAASIADTQRGISTKIPAADIASIHILGRVVYRCGLV